MSRLCISTMASARKAKTGHAQGAEVICPKTLHPCIDDLCYGGGCLELGGAPMLSKCPGCGALISDEDDMNCTCEEEWVGRDE